MSKDIQNKLDEMINEILNILKKEFPKSSQEEIDYAIIEALGDFSNRIIDNAHTYLDLEGE